MVTVLKVLNPDKLTVDTLLSGAYFIFLLKRIKCVYVTFYFCFIVVIGVIQTLIHHIDFETIL